MKIAFLAGLIAVTVPGSAIATSCPAHIWPGRTQRDGGTFYFGFSGTCSRIDVFALEVRPVAQEEAICIVHAREVAMAHELKRGWKYGAVPDGFVARKPCEPLKVGVEYKIDVSGTCSGYRFFSVDKRGRIQMARDPKQPCGPRFRNPGRL